MFLSHRSSNPLEASPSDARNKAYNEAYREALVANGPSSDDLGGYDSPEMGDYLLYVTRTMGRSSEFSRRPGKMFDLNEDENMDSDDELRLGMDMTVDKHQDDKQERNFADELKYPDEEKMDEAQEQDDMALKVEEQAEGPELERQLHDLQAVKEEQLPEEPPKEYEIEVVEETHDLEDFLDSEDVPETEDSSDGEESFLLKSDAEQAEIIQEIAKLEERIPQLTKDYKLLDRLGTGTFSSVFKAYDLGYHSTWDNTVWHGHHPPSSSAHYQSLPQPNGTKNYVAIKRILTTSSPERIRNEIAIMETCRGSRHVSQLITAFRVQDQVVVIMPYHRNEDFRVSLSEIVSFCRFSSLPRNTLLVFPWKGLNHTFGVCSALYAISTLGLSYIGMSNQPISSLTREPASERCAILGLHV